MFLPKKDLLLVHCESFPKPFHSHFFLLKISLAVLLDELSDFQIGLILPSNTTWPKKK